MLVLVNETEPSYSNLETNSFTRRVNSICISYGFVFYGITFGTDPDHSFYVYIKVPYKLEVVWLMLAFVHYKCRVLDIMRNDAQKDPATDSNVLRARLLVDQVG